MELSAYNINRDGVLVYAGLPVESKVITFEHHNGEPYKVGGSNLSSEIHYEVWRITSHGLAHGRPTKGEEGVYIQLGLVWRYFDSI